MTFIKQYSINWFREPKPVLFAAPKDAERSSHFILGEIPLVPFSSAQIPVSKALSAPLCVCLCSSPVAAMTVEKLNNMKKGAQTFHCGWLVTQMPQSPGPVGSPHSAAVRKLTLGWLFPQFPEHTACHLSQEPDSSRQPTVLEPQPCWFHCSGGILCFNLVKIPCAALKFGTFVGRLFHSEL